MGAFLGNLKWVTKAGSGDTRYVWGRRSLSFVHCNNLHVVIGSEENIHLISVQISKKIKK